MNNKRRIIIIFFVVVFSIVLVNLVITNTIIKHQIKSSSVVQFSTSSGGQSAGSDSGGNISSSEFSSTQNLSRREEECLDEFYHLTRPLFGFNKDSKFSEWKEECFDKLSSFKEEEFVDIYEKYLSFFTKLGQCYPDKGLNQIGSSAFEECRRMFSLHLGCEFYRKEDDKEALERIKSLGKEFSEKILVNPNTLSSLKLEFDVGKCNVSVGEEFLKAKEFFCKGIFSGVNFIEK